MPDYKGKPEFLEKTDIPSDSGEDFLREWERVDVYLPTTTEISPVPEESRLVVYSDPTCPGADRFRMAQIRLKSLQAARKLKNLLITSPLPMDGKSTVALNMATVLAENGKVPVLLVEADVYRPVLVNRLGLEPWPGLTECYEHGDDPIPAIRRIEPLGINLLPAGHPVEDGVGLFQSNFAKQLFKRLSSSFFSWILIDAPPTTPVASILALKAYANATLLVARAGYTPREAIEESTRNLGSDQILGIILNGVEGLDHIYSKYYGYRYGKPKRPAKPAKHKAIESLGLNELAK